jgi:hypothetical protein
MSAYRTSNSAPECRKMREAAERRDVRFQATSNLLILSAGHRRCPELDQIRDPASELAKTLETASAFVNASTGPEQVRSIWDGRKIQLQLRAVLEKDTDGERTISVELKRGPTVTAEAH